MLRVVIIGYGEMLTNLIAAALDSNCNIVGVLRNETIKHSPFTIKIKNTIFPSKEYNYLKSYNIPEITDVKSVNSNSFRKKLITLNPDIVLVGSWSEKFEKTTFDIPKIATINAHPSLLPKYRGPNPYFWTIRNCETESGITFHLMDKGFDTGAILAQEKIKISPSETGKSLKQKTVLVARKVACELLNSLKEDIIIPLQQREDRASYYSHPENLEIDFKQSSKEICALIRASYPWTRTWFYHKDTLLTPDPKFCYIEENKTSYNNNGTIVDVDIKNNALSIICGDNKILKLSNLKLYKKIDQPFTKNYIKREIKIGDNLIQ